jgi:hypothetical protein
VKQQAEYSEDDSDRNTGTLISPPKGRRGPRQAQPFDAVAAWGLPVLSAALNQLHERKVGQDGLSPQQAAYLHSQSHSLRKWVWWVLRCSNNPYVKTSDKRLVRKLLTAIKQNQARHFDRKAFRRILDAFAEYLAYSDDPEVKGWSRGTRARLLSIISVFLQSDENASSVGLPTIDDPIGYPEGRPRRYNTSTTPTLAELTRSGVVNWKDPDEAVVRLLGDSGLNAASLSFDEKLRAIAGLNRTRLDALRRALEAELKVAYERFLTGERLLNIAGLPSAEEFKNQLCAYGHSLTFPKWLAEVTGNDPEKKMALILRYSVANLKGGLVQGERRFKDNRTFRDDALWRHFSCHPKTLNYIDHLQSFLTLTPLGWNAAFGILLIDTGWNLQPLIDLPVNCFVGELNHPLIFLTMKSMPYCSMGNTPLPP